MSKLKVFIVDDSATVRRVFTDMLDGKQGINVIGSAMNPILAWRKMEKDWPDVIISDIEMPEMNGIDFLKKVMTEHPTPVIICSGYAEKVGESTMNAMASGAVEVIHKPAHGIKEFLQESSASIFRAIKAASSANLSRLKVRRQIASQPKEVVGKNTADAVVAVSSRKKIFKKTANVIAIGCSTGGTQALEAILTKLPENAPGIIIVQHMPAGFTNAFAKRLNSLCAITVKEAESGDVVNDGCAYIAQGDKHMLLRRMGSYYELELKDGPLVSRHKPSVDVLFRSTANVAGMNATGFILTGMGDDGASGLLEMKQAGSKTYAQDESTSVVYGMPKIAYERGATDKLIKLEQVASIIMENINK